MEAENGETHSCGGTSSGSHSNIFAQKKMDDLKDKSEAFDKIQANDEFRQHSLFDSLLQENVVKLLDVLREKSKAFDEVQAADEFRQHSLFDSLVRDNVAKFLDKNTLYNYSLCSKECNKEIQKFNNIAPEVVKISEEEDGIDVKYGKKNRVNRYHPSGMGVVDVSFEFDDYASYDEILNSIEAHFVKSFKYVNERNTKEIDISMTRWPTGMMNKGFFPEVEEMSVKISDSLLENFVEFAKTTNMRVTKKLNLWKDLDDEELTNGEKKIELFQSGLIQQAACVNVVTEINDDDFLALMHPNLTFELPHRDISDEAIRRKVAQINSTAVVHNISISVGEGSFELQDIFPHEHLEHQYYQYHESGFRWFRRDRVFVPYRSKAIVGRVVLETEGNHKNLKIHQRLV